MGQKSLRTTELNKTRNVWCEHTVNSGVTDRAIRGRAAPHGKLNTKTGLPLADILIFSIFYFFEVFSFFYLVLTSTTSRDSLSFLNLFLGFG